MEWIKIENSETMPEPKCLAYWSDDRYTCLESQDDCEYAIGGGNEYYHVTHWMPLPDPPVTKE